MGKTIIFYRMTDGNSVVVLTHGLIKKTQKTPQLDIERAETYRRDYLQRRIKR